jgi:hypothetical protein
MDNADPPPQPDEPPTSEDGEQSRWPRRQVYYLTVEWLDEPHKPDSPERLARAIRDALEHAHNLPTGTPPARFVVRVKAEDVASEVEGKIEHHHHH